MPEMPEVETLARKLRRSIVGKQVAEVRLSGFSLRKPIADTFSTVLRGRTIVRILRRGKYIIAEMKPKAYWVIHLGMSGSVLYRPGSSAPAKHTHAIFRFEDSSELEYRDHRRFGLLSAYEVPRLKLVPEVCSLGMDPLLGSFKAQWLLPRLNKSHQEIKSFLLDQSKIAGLGNIYACESLFYARIHPSRRCYTLDRSEAARLVNAIRKVLGSAIRNKGTTFSDFMDSNGDPGDNQRFLRVFQREGEPCYRCHNPIERIRQGNRSSFYCSCCQVWTLLLKGRSEMTESYRKCSHCKGTGKCRNCHGTGRLALQKGKACTSCYPHGSGNCQNCRGLGGFDASGNPAKAE